MWRRWCVVRGLSRGGETGKWDGLGSGGTLMMLAGSCRHVSRHEECLRRKHAKRNKSLFQNGGRRMGRYLVPANLSSHHLKTQRLINVAYINNGSLKHPFYSQSEGHLEGFIVRCERGSSFRRETQHLRPSIQKFFRIQNTQTRTRSPKEGKPSLALCRVRSMGSFGNEGRLGDDGAKPCETGGKIIVGEKGYRPAPRPAGYSTA